MGASVISGFVVLLACAIHYASFLLFLFTCFVACSHIVLAPPRGSLPRLKCRGVAVHALQHVLRAVKSAKLR